MNICDLVGKRVLLKSTNDRFNYSNEPEEFKIIEISPSGAWVKLMNLNGKKFWRAIIAISFVEELIDFKQNNPDV